MQEYEKNCISEYSKDEMYEQLNEYSENNMMPIT